MECKLAEYWISLYIDDQLEEEAITSLMEHIEGCSKCRSYFEQSVEMDHSIKGLFQEDNLNSEFTSKVMKDIKVEKRRKSIFRKQNVKAALTAVVLISALLFLPINGKTVLAHMNDWVKNLTIRQPGLVIQVKERNSQESASHSKGKKIPIDINTKYLSTKEGVLETVYNIEKKPCLPDYMLDGYIFDHAYYGKNNDESIDDFYISSYYIKEADKSSMKDNITVKLVYQKEGTVISGTRYYLSENEVAKEISADGEKGVVVKRDFKTGFHTYEARFILNRYGLNVEIDYRIKDDTSNIEESITKIADPLIKQLKESLSENMITEPQSISTVIESTDCKEFMNKIAHIDDRIVPINAIPEGYTFDKGTFIENPKEIEAFSISSDFHSTYRKGNAAMQISMYLHTHTDKNSDFFTYENGEIIRREAFMDYEIKIYKEKLNLSKTQTKVISVDMRDYAVSINVRATGTKDEILELTEMKNIIKDIIDNIHKQSTPRETKDFGRNQRMYDNLDAFINSKEIAQSKLIAPAYIPKGYEFEKAICGDDSYVLTLGRILTSTSPQKSITPYLRISMRKGDFPHLWFDGDEDSIQSIKVLNKEGSILIDRNSYKGEYGIVTARFEIELTDIDYVLEIWQDFYEEEKITNNEIIEITESIIKQITK